MRRYTMPSVEPEYQMPAHRLGRLLDVSPWEALPHRDVSTVTPHKPGVTGVRLTETVVETELVQLRHLYDVRTRPHLYFDGDVDTTVDAWHKIARDHGRLLYDCAPCKATWPIQADANTCPLGHDMGE